MTDKQQTAVAWLKPLMLQLSCFITHEQLHLWNQAFEKALAMEQKQIEEAYNQGIEATYQFNYGDGKRYFTETYEQS